MPQSRHRHKHTSHQPHHAPAKRKRSAAVMMTFFMALLGAAVALIASGTNSLWLGLGAVIGAIAGYLMGHSMDKMAQKNK